MEKIVKIENAMRLFISIGSLIITSFLCVGLMVVKPPQKPLPGITTQLHSLMVKLDKRYYPDNEPYLVKGKHGMYKYYLAEPRVFYFKKNGTNKWLVLSLAAYKNKSHK